MSGCTAWCLGRQRPVEPRTKTGGWLDKPVAIGDGPEMPTLVWQFQGRIAVAVHGPSDPSNLEWGRYLRDTLAQPDASQLRVLIVSHGGKPSGSQRKDLMEVLPRPAPTAYLSNGWIARSLINTMSWFNPQLRAFGLNDDEAACRFLELTRAEAMVARKVREALEAELGMGADQSDVQSD